MTSLLLSAPVALMYLPSLLESDAGVEGVRTISLGGAHLYAAVLLMIPLVILGIGLWYLCYYCRREDAEFPISRYHCVWGLAFMIHLIVGIRITLWTEMEVYGDENSDLTDALNIQFDADSTWLELYKDNRGYWATYFKTFSIVVLSVLSSTTATMCTKADCLAIETREQLKQIADDGAFSSLLCQFSRSCFVSFPSLFELSLVGIWRS